MSRFKFANVKRYKRGAKWPNGDPRMCSRCGWQQRSRRGQAVVTANILWPRPDGGRARVPVGYCPEHIPAELRATA